MNNKKFKIISFAILSVLFGITLLFTANKNSGGESYILKAYNNSVALYKGDELIQIYDDIVLNTLPKSDIITLKSGIIIENIDDIGRLLQDFDG